jgi:hypothetical protein
LLEAGRRLQAVSRASCSEQLKSRTELDVLQTQVVTVTKLFDEILDCLNSKIDLETIHHLKNVLREKKKMK